MMDGARRYGTHDSGGRADGRPGGVPDKGRTDEREEYGRPPGHEAAADSPSPIRAPDVAEGPDGVMELVAETAARLTGAKTVLITRAAPGTTSVAYKYAYGIHARELVALVNDLADAGICERAVLGKRPVVSGGLASGSRLHALARALGLTNMAAVPVISGERVIGGITALGKAAGGFTQKDLGVLEVLAGFANTALENAGANGSVAVTAAEKEKAEAVLSSIHDGLLFINKDGVITHANKAISGCFPMKPQELIGANVRDFLSSAPLALAFSWEAKAQPGRRCWEVTACTEVSCPMHKSALLRCWSFSGGHCGRKEYFTGREDKKPAEACAGCVVLAHAAGRLAEPREVQVMGKVFRVKSTIVVPDAATKVFGEVIVFQDITSHKMMERRRSDFVSMVTHDLKAPLTSIMGYCELSSAHDDIDKIKEMNKAVVKSSSKMLKMINDFLDLSRIDTCEIRLDLKSIPARTLLKNTVEPFMSQADARGVHLSWSAQKGTPPVMADADQLGRVLSNLLSNSLKYVGAGGEIAVSAARGPEGFVELTVTDNGPGIGDEQLPRIFDRYYTGGAAGCAGSAGLGLSIVKMLTEAHGGQVSVTSEEGKGCSFSVLIPSAGKPGPDRCKSS